MSKELVIEVDRDSVTGKWFTQMTVPDGTIYRSMPCDTEEQAVALRDKGIEAVKTALGKKVKEIRFEDE